MLPDQVSNPGPLTYESGALPIVLRGLASRFSMNMLMLCCNVKHLVLPTNLMPFATQSSY